VVWEGKIQPRFTDTYFFYCTYNDVVTIYINDTLVLNGRNGSDFAPTFIKGQRPFSMVAGRLYRIRIEYANKDGIGDISLYWQSASLQQQFEVVPASQLYSTSITDAMVTSTIHTDTTYYCYLPRPVKPKRVTLDRFSPLQGKQMVVSAWVKEQQDCTPDTYSNSQVVLSFDAGSPSSVTLKPAGRIIEGWQRVEDTVTVPAGATMMKLSFKSTNGSVPVYFDDVRMHPFNSNMKSFVYNPVNLRLMAELDENNYATFYEYDDDGTLVRLKKETERGIKTIKETRSALLKD
jgi:hypothetical protein